MQDMAIRSALTSDELVDITTTGRRSGQPHRFEIWFHYLDGEVYLTGKPAPRDWYANMLAHPQITFHLKESLRADLPASTVPIINAAQRRTILMKLLEGTDYWDNLEAWIAGSPLIRIEIEGLSK